MKDLAAARGDPGAESNTRSTLSPVRTCPRWHSLSNQVVPVQVENQAIDKYDCSLMRCLKLLASPPCSHGKLPYRALGLKNGYPEDASSHIHKGALSISRIPSRVTGFFLISSMTSSVSFSFFISNLPCFLQSPCLMKHCHPVPHGDPNLQQFVLNHK